MKTLVIEDEPIRHLSIEQQIRSYGYDVTICPGAEIALEIYCERFYPLIVLDLGTPGIDGAEFCRRIRELPWGDRSIILIITTYNKPEDLQAAIEAGADDYLIKPVNTEMLQGRLTIIERQIQNLTQRGQVEDNQRKKELFKKSEQRLIAMLRSIGEGVIATDTKGAITFMNPVAEALTGWRQEEVLGKEIIFHNHRRRYTNPHREPNNQGSSRRYSYQYGESFPACQQGRNRNPD